MADSKPLIRDARLDDLPAIAAYLAPRLRGRGGEVRYRRLLEYRWLAEKPNLGFLIDHGGQLGGFIGAIYSHRRLRERDHLFCNLTSWHVEERFRNLSLALMGRLLAQPDCTFTTFSPNDTVVELLKFFKFKVLNSEKAIFAPLSGVPGLLRRPRPRIFWGKELMGRLTDVERRIFEDHRSYRCGQFLIEHGGDRCYFITVRRGRGATAFADVLYASDPTLLARSIAWTHVPIARAHGTLLTGIDRRLLHDMRAGVFTYRGSRPLMFRSDTMAEHEIDTLYSELIPMYG